MAAVLVLAGCSSSATPAAPSSAAAGTASTVNGVQTVTLTAGDDLRFSPTTITVHPGMVEVILKNTGQGAPHNFEVMGLPGTAVPLASAGQTTMKTFMAPAPGTYTFVCTIHEAQGQKGTLIVLPT